MIYLSQQSTVEMVEKKNKKSLDPISYVDLYISEN